jgi:LuxR family transcriptional regulator, maltose regulon positive regulatory protein
MSSTGKLMYPTIPPAVLHRQVLVAELLRAVAGQSDQTAGTEGYKVILLCAPAGYGKTTLLADFARHSPLPCCWYFLDASDENPVAFLQLLIESIRQPFPGFGASLDALLGNIAEVENEQKLHHLKVFVETLTQTISAEIPERFTLLLCDYHELDPQWITSTLINHFIQHMPAQCTLFLESRSTPNLDFVFLLAQQLILAIGSNRLRFSSSEIHELAQLQHVDLTESEVVYLEQSFEGWITGILLATRLGNVHLPISIGPQKNTSVGQSGREHLFAYLVRYVFVHHTEAYHFLRETAILRHMTPDLCNALLAVSDSASRLTYLEEQGLFVTHYQNGQEDIFVCLPILRELLYDELQRQAPLHLTELHLRAVELFRGQQDTEAVAHALAAKDFRTAAQFIEALASRLFTSGEQVLLARWLDALPDEIIREYPRLLLSRATLFLEESLLPNVQGLLDQAIAALPVEQDTQSLRAEIFLTRAKLLMQQGNYALAQELSAQALTLLEIDEVDLRVTAHQVQGSCAAFLNNFTASIAELQQALQLFGRETQTRQVAKLHTMLANFYGMTGHNSLSEHHRTRAIQCWSKLNDEWGRIDNILGLGAIKGRQGATEEAMQLFSQALSLSRGAIHYECGEAYALANLGDLYQDQDKFEHALIAYEDGLTLGRQIDEVYLVHYIICELARTYLLMGDPHGAQSILAQLDPDMPALDSTSSYEQALYIFTCGTLLLQTGQTDEAYRYLTAAESAFVATKYEYIQAQIYRAACLLALGETQLALQQTADACQLARECNYEELVQRELRRCPCLLRYVKTNEPALLQGLKGLITVRKTASRSESVETPVIVADAGQQNLPVLFIQALGIPNVYRDDALLKHWRMAKSMELFFLLLNAPHPLHKERIIANLWPDKEELTDQTWRSTLHYLRKVLGADCIYARNSVYRLQLEKLYTVRYDVASFQSFSIQARTAQRMGDDETARLAFEKMVALYKGDFVASFYSDWCAFRRDELRQACIDAHHQLALISWQQEHLDESIFHWQHIIAMDIMIEVAHEGLIRCYLQQGKRYLALHHYNQYVSFLQKELGVLPGDTFQSLLNER